MTFKIPWSTARIFLALIVLLMIPATTTYGENTMQAIYFLLNRASMPKLDPKIYSTKKIELWGLQDIPIDNAVATSRLRGTNAVTMIEFRDNNKVKYKTIAKNFKSDVGGGETVYLPVFSEDTIGYSQTRGFNLLNIKTEKNRYFSIIGETSSEIKHIAVVNAEKRIFLFSIVFYGAEKPLQLFRLMDLSTEEGKVIEEKFIDGLYSWIYADNTIFLNHRRNNSVTALNLKLEHCDHPLVKYFNENNEKFKGLFLAAVHPKFHFAIIQENVGEITSVVTWDGEDNFKIFKIIDKLHTGATGGYRFTDDGKWVFFRDVTHGIGSRDYILMPVDPKLPHYLGQPVDLGNVPNYPDNVTAITRNPTGLVAAGRIGDTEENCLYKWDFTQAIPLIENQK